jgi:hypothetical protein
MKSPALKIALAAALLLTSAPLLASASDAQASPIQVDNVAIDPYYGSYNDYNPGTAFVQFTNQYNAPATRIVFALESNGKILAESEDAGSFAKGQTARYNFQDVQLNTDQSVAVESATFADGTVWTNPDLQYAYAR